MKARRASVVLLVVALGGCTAVENDLRKGLRYGLGSDSLTRKDEGRGSGRPHAVNAYLWRAALDTVGFLPLEKADPANGQIVTQWYAVPGEPGTRSRMVVEVLDPDLRRDTIRVTVSRQVQDAQGAWASAPAPSGTAQSLEDSIYTKARDIAPF